MAGEANSRSLVTSEGVTACWSKPCCESVMPRACLTSAGLPKGLPGRDGEVAPSGAELPAAARGRWHFLGPSVGQAAARGRGAGNENWVARKRVAGNDGLAPTCALNNL